MAESSSSRRRRQDDSDEFRSDSDDTSGGDSSVGDTSEESSSGEDAGGPSRRRPAKKAKKGKGPARKQRAVGKKSAYFKKNKAKLMDGLEKVPGRLQTQLVKMPARMVEVDKKGADAIRQNQPPKTMADLLGMLPTITFDDVWTQEEENRFKANLEADPYHQYIVSDEALPLATNHNFWTMWKTIPRLRNCFPTDIIGAKVQLKYGTSIDIGGGVSKPDLRWSSNFCGHLTELALGSPCGANMRLLSLLIRYTVADRIDDRRKASFDDSKTGNKFFDEFSLAVRQHNQDKPLRELHAEIRGRWKQDGIFLPWESDVMCSIESLNDAVRSQRPTMPIPGHEFPEYAVLTADLSRVIRACDQTDDLGLGYPKLFTVEHRAALAAHGRTRHDPLQYKNKEELYSLRTPLLEDEERFKAKRLLEAQRLPVQEKEDLPGASDREDRDDHLELGDLPPMPDENDSYQFLDSNSASSSREGSQTRLQDIEDDSDDDSRATYAMCEPPEGLEMLTLDEEEEFNVGDYAKGKGQSLSIYAEENKSTAQPLNLPEAAFSVTKDKKIGATSTSLQANAAGVLSDLGYVGRLFPGEL